MTQTVLFGSDRYAGVKRSAEISECGRYRWWLRRHWPNEGWPNDENRTVCFIMLNPSTADGLTDDPTIRRCMGFALDWGFSTLSVRNLFPYRATDPKELKKAGREIATGGDRGYNELRAARSASLVIAAWGADVPFCTIQYLFGEVPQGMCCLGTTKSGAPRHPLYVKSTQKPVLWEPAA